MCATDYHFFIQSVIKSCRTPAQLRQARGWALKAFDKNYNAGKPRRFLGFIDNYEYGQNEKNRAKFRADIERIALEQGRKIHAIKELS